MFKYQATTRQVLVRVLDVLGKISTTQMKSTPRPFNYCWYSTQECHRRKP